MSALREILATFDIIVNDSALQAADKRLDSFVDKLKGLGAALAGFGIVKTFAAFGAEVAKSAREVEFHAGRMEMETDEYQRLSQVASNYGMTMEQLQIANTLFTRALSGMGGTMGEFRDRTGQARDAMRALGLDAHQFKGQKLEQILPVISDAMKKIEDPMERVAIGIRLFGHRGRAILPMMAQGADELRRQFAAAVPVFEKATIESADKATIAGKNLGRTWDNLVNNSLGKAALDIFAKVATKLTDIVLGMKELIKNSEIGKGIIVALGVALAAAATLTLITWAPVLVPILAILAAFAALALIVDDFIVFMEGGKSVIGRFFNELLGEGGAQAARDKIKELWGDFKGFLEELKSKAFKNFMSDLSGDIAAIRDFFREIMAAINWIDAHVPKWMTIKPSAAGPAEDYGMPEVAKRLANTAPPPTMTGGSGPPSADQVDKYGEMAYKAPTGQAPLIGITINGGLDAKDLANKLKPVVEGVVDQHHRDAMGAVGGAK